MTKQIKQGEGWRVGWDENATVYQGLIGNEDWGIELTALEVKELQRLLAQLIDSLNIITEELMPEEKISVEVESEILWLEAEGYSNDYSLRLILHQNRRCEAYWPAKVTQSLIQAIQTINIW
jgi:hypothetical protein